MRFGASSTSLVALVVGTFINAASPCKAQCNSNNCLRAFRNEEVITAARSFCSSYTVATTWTAPLPTFASACSASASRISSACSCIASSSSSSFSASVTTTTTRGTSSTTSTSSGSFSSSSTSVTTSSSTFPSPSSSSTSTSSTSSVSSSSSSSPASQTSSTSASSTSTTSNVGSTTSACNTAAPSTVFVTVSASTVTVTSNSTTTVTAYSYPANANPGATNVPNPNFESPIPSPPTDYCRNTRASARCSIVQTSDPGFGTTFQGLFGPGMLRAGASNTEGALSDARVPVPIVNTPHPQGRNWVLSAYFRSDPGNPSSCWPIMGFESDDGTGFGSQPNYSDDGTWQRFSRELPNSAQGRAGTWGVYVTAGCYPENNHMYIDGVTIT